MNIQEIKYFNMKFKKVRMLMDWEHFDINKHHGAYDLFIIDVAKRKLGDMLEYAVNGCNLDIDEYFELFANSNIGIGFGNGETKYIYGRSACELVHDVYFELFMKEIPRGRQIFDYEKGAKHWTGWSLAQYQWYSCRPFFDILRDCKISDIRDMYYPYHEMDITKFIDKMEELHKKELINRGNLCCTMVL